MNRWEHLTQVPEDVRLTMSTAFLTWEKQDLGNKAVVDGMIRAPHVTQRVCETLRSSANSIRVPELCRMVKAAHPSRSWRDVFQAVALFVGIHHKNIQKLFYLERKCSK